MLERTFIVDSYSCIKHRGTHYGIARLERHIRRESQLFSNVYLNELDQFVKRQLRCRRYGRYVDDFYVVSADREWLASLRQPIAHFLQSGLGLEVNEGKTRICDVRTGVEFLGVYMKPRRRYVSNDSRKRMERKVLGISENSTPEQLRSRLNSFLGLLSHYKSYRLRKGLFCGLAFVFRCGYYQRGMCRYVIFPSSA